MKKMINLFLIVFYLISLTSCIKSEKPTFPSDSPTALVIVSGNHSNSKKINAPIEDKVKSVYSNFGNACFIVVDGNPTVEFKDGKMIGFYDAEYIEKSKDAYVYKDIWKRDYLDKPTSLFKKELEKAQANDPEVDTLKAIQVASDALNTMQSSMGLDIKKEIIICDTGLSTTGTLNFLNPDYLNLLSSNTLIQQDEDMKSELNRLLDNLENSMEIPNLSGITVTWYGLGKVDEPQSELSNLNIQNLQYIWGELLLRANAVPSNESGTDQNYSMFIDVVAYDTINNDYKVSQVILWGNIGNNVQEDDDTYNNDKTEVENFVEPPVITEEEVGGFVPNTAEYKSEESAIAMIEPYAKNLQLYPDMQILLVGTTADPNRNGGSVELSEKRAEKVKETFVKLGVSESRIKTIGVGAKSSHYEDEWISGNFDEEIARKNRSVIILPYDSNEAQNILKKDWN